MSEKQAKEIIRTIQTVCVTLLLLIIAYAVARHILAEICGKEPIITTVIDCRQYNGDEFYTVTVEDVNGEQWVYYDYDYREVGEVIDKNYTEGR